MKRSILVTALAFGITAQAQPPPAITQQFVVWSGTTTPDGMWRINGDRNGVGGNQILVSNAKFQANIAGADDGNVLALTVPANVKQGAEIQSLPQFGYGYYEAKMKVTPVPGVVASFFWIQAPPYGPQEIDIEFLTNESGFASPYSRVHYTLHPGNSSFDQSLSFDPTAEFHRYGFLFTPGGNVAYTIDGAIVRRFTYPRLTLSPGTSGFVMANTWTGTRNWGGGPPTQAATTLYDWIKIWPNAISVPDPTR